MEMNFCRQCGSLLICVNGHVYRCTNEHTIFLNCSPTVGIFFLTPDNRVLLSVRGIEPHKGMLDSLGGFLDGEESFEAAAVREIREETLLQPGDYEDLAYLTSAVGHYPYGREVLPTISVFFWTRLKPGKLPVATDDVAQIKSIPLHQVKPDELHDDDVRHGISELQRLFPK